jgi:hypothetical protein
LERGAANGGCTSDWWGQIGMTKKRTGGSSVKTGTDWKRVRSLSDRQIRRGIENDPDARRTDAEFWKKAHVVIPAAR